MTYHAEDGCDQWIHEHLPLPEYGCYVDVGCAHPFQYSQTAFLRHLGWTGVAIDGNDAYRSEWKPIEKVHFIHAVVSTEDACRFLVEPTNTLVSRRHETGKIVQCFTLDWLLRFVPKIDFMSLDVEGMEFEALLSLTETEKYPPTIVAEYRSEHAGEDFRVLHHLVGLGYKVVHLTKSNIAYHKSL